MNCIIEFFISSCKNIINVGTKTEKVTLPTIAKFTTSLCTLDPKQILGTMLTKVNANPKIIMTRTLLMVKIEFGGVGTGRTRSTSMSSTSGMPNNSSLKVFSIFAVGVVSFITG